MDIIGLIKINIKVVKKYHGLLKLTINNGSFLFILFFVSKQKWDSKLKQYNKILSLDICELKTE